MRGVIYLAHVEFLLSLLLPEPPAVFIVYLCLCVHAAPSSHRHNECQIWPGGLQQFTEAHFNLHPVVHGGDVTPHKVCGGTEGPGNQPEQLQRPHTVLNLCGWSLPLLPHIWISAGIVGSQGRKTQYDWCTCAYTHTHIYINKSWSVLQWKFSAVVCLWTSQSYHCLIVSVSVILYSTIHSGADIFRRGFQAFWLVPHFGPVWFLLHVWTGGASAHTGQTQKVKLTL